MLLLGYLSSKALLSEFKCMSKDSNFGLGHGLGHNKCAALHWFTLQCKLHPLLRLFQASLDLKCKTVNKMKQDKHCIAKLEISWTNKPLLD